jgi:hypothetical protein
VIDSIFDDEICLISKPLCFVAARLEHPPLASGSGTQFTTTSDPLMSNGNGNACTPTGNPSTASLFQPNYELPSASTLQSSASQFQPKFEFPPSSLLQPPASPFLFEPKSEYDTPVSPLKAGMKRCEVCHKMILRNMARHMLVHTGEKNHVCAICSKVFNRKDNLQCHLQLMHKETTAS